LRQQQQAEQSQNMLKKLFSDPQSYDPQSGKISPRALRGVMGIDPDTGMKLMQDQTQLADVKLKRMGAIQDMIAPVRDSSLEAYDAAIKAGASDQAARMAAQKVLDDGIAPLKTGGTLSGDEQAQLVTKFDPTMFRARALSYKDQKALEARQASEDIAAKREEDAKRRTDALIAAINLKDPSKTKWDVRVDKDGTEYRYNVDTTKATTLTGEPYTPKGGAGKVGSKPGVTFTPEMGALGAALAEKGVSLPAGLRSQSQQATMYQGLLDRHPDKTPDEIADMVKTGQIELGAQKKETQTAAALAGKTEVGENELVEFAPQALEASSKVPRGKFVPYNKLLQMGEASISDPDLKELKSWTNTVLNAYDVVAARGGTDKDKRAQNRENLMTADSPETYERALKVILKEAEGAKAAAIKATKVPELKDEGAKTETSDQPGKTVDYSKTTNEELKKKLGIP
jgi:hypothetical protein